MRGVPPGAQQDGGASAAAGRGFHPWPGTVGLHPVLAAVNNAAMNTGIQVSLLSYVSASFWEKLNMIKAHGTPPIYTCVPTRGRGEGVACISTSYEHLPTGLLLARQANGGQHCDLLLWLGYRT